MDRDINSCTDKEVIELLKKFMHEAKNRGLDLGDVLVEVLGTTQGKFDFEYLLSRALKGQINKDRVKGYVIAVEMQKGEPFVAYKGDARSVMGLLATVAGELTRRDDIALFLIRLLSAALDTEDELRGLQH